MISGARIITATDLAQRLAGVAKPGAPLIVGLTGSVAVGKTTLARDLVAALPALRIETHSTDGFLLSNARLAELGLGLRKGFPESYDQPRLAEALAAVRTGPAVFPGYSHVTYDPDPALDCTIEAPDILLLEGLGLIAARSGLDLLIYVDAEEADLESWFLERFMGFWRAAETDPASFYAQFRTMDEAGAETFARAVWAGINLPNLRDHILPARAMADIVVRKDADHGLHLVRG
jgi:type I pantothenate kinase